MVLERVPAETLLKIKFGEKKKPETPANARKKTEVSVKR